MNWFMNKLVQKRRTYTVTDRQSNRIYSAMSRAIQASNLGAGSITILSRALRDEGTGKDRDVVELTLHLEDWRKRYVFWKTFNKEIGTF